MKTSLPLVLFCCFILQSASLFAVAKPSQEEKVYLHFDNTAYFLGETIWFKAYVVQAGRNALSPLSKTLYVDLITPEGGIVESKKLKIVDGTCNGDFLLKDSLVAGFYEVRAYTRFMLNQGNEAVFSRVFACYDKPLNTGDFLSHSIWKRPNSEKLYDYRPKNENNGKLSLLFYPEGGNWVEGVTTKVAFKGFDKTGENADFTGLLLSAKGDTLTDISATHQGMGAFVYTPTQQPATAVVTYKNKTLRFELPKPVKSGYTLNVDASETDRLQILVQQSSGMPFEKLGLDISCRGQLYGVDTLSFSQGNAVALTFPTRMLPSGVIQITLHTQDGRVVSQRLVFVNHHTQMRFEAKTDKASYKPYELIKLDFALSDNKGQPLETTFSLAVRDAEATPNDPYTDNVLTNLLLCSELKGYIQSPGYYFQNDDPDLRADLDLLMLTQGWTRYEWKRIAGLDTTQFLHLYEESLLIEGNAYTLLRKKAKKGLEVTMILTNDSTSQHGTCSTDVDGRFNMALADFSGKASLTIETKEDEKRKEHVIRLDRVFSPAIKTYDANETRLPEWPSQTDPFLEAAANTDSVDVSWADTISLTKPESSVKSYLLKQVEVNAERLTTMQQEGLREASVAVNVEESLDALLDKGEWVPASILTALYELLPYFSCTTQSGPRFKGKSAAVLIDNRPLSEVASMLFGVESTDPYEQLNQIGSIEVSLVTVKEGFNLSLYTLGTDVMSTTEQPEVSIYIYTNPKRKVPIGIRNTTFIGYAWSKSFYNPPYDLLLEPDVSDVRRTLYWNPDVKTNAVGKATVSFYNNRSSKSLNINAETVTENGIFGVLNQ